MDLGSIRDAFSGRYDIIRCIGEGGMASVYLAHDAKHDRDLAIKVLRPELLETTAAARFSREIQVEGRLQHPHILPIYDSGIASGLPYYVMPYVEGETLRDKIARQGALTVDEALQIGEEICDALAYAHARGIVHRDIKPGNVLLSGGHAVVADFGIARVIAESGAGRLTKSGVAVGTAAYLSPEQALGEESADVRSDVYSTGCVLYEMLTGDTPFTGRSDQAVIAKHISLQVPSMEMLRPGLDPELIATVERALAKVPADRFRDAGDLRDILSRLRSRSTAASDPGTGRTGRTPRPSGIDGTVLATARPRRTGGILVGMALAVGLAMAVWFAIRPAGVGLDSYKVVVFPFWDEQGGGGDGLLVADMVRNAVELAFPLRADDGWSRLDGEERANISRLTARRARSISRQRGARYYIDGRVVSDRDAIHVTVLVTDVEGDSVIAQATESGAAGASAVPVGLRALIGTLGNWLDPGRELELTTLQDRRPEAVITWMHGEREYRFMRVNRALEFYEQAVTLDPQLTQAALKGAQAAAWEERHAEADRLTAIATASADGLPPHYRALLDGIRYYIGGLADSAVASVERALAIRSDWSEAWMLLGEIHHHLLPDEPALDSLAGAAFERARELDPEFTPPLFHLAELAVLAGDIPRAERYAAGLEARAEDDALEPQFSLLLTCARDGPDRTPWDEVVAESPTAALGAAQLLAAGAHYPECAERGARAVIASPHSDHHWGAYLVLQGLLVAQGRNDELDVILNSDAARSLPLDRLLLLYATGTPGLVERARKIAALAEPRIETLSTSNLWLLAQWYLSQGSVESARAVVGRVEEHVHAGGAKRDSIILAGLSAQLGAAGKATAEALAILSGVRRVGNKADLVWQPWEAMDRERLLLAEALLDAGRPAEAFAVATEIDSHRAVVHLAFLQQSLNIRLRAARALDLEQQARVIEQRLATLRGGGRAQ